MKRNEKLNIPNTRPRLPQMHLQQQPSNQPNARKLTNGRKRTRKGLPSSLACIHIYMYVRARFFISFICLLAWCHRSGWRHRCGLSTCEHHQMLFAGLCSCRLAMPNQRARPSFAGSRTISPDIYIRPQATTTERGQREQAPSKRAERKYR